MHKSSFVLDKAEYSAFVSTLNSAIVSYRIAFVHIFLEKWIDLRQTRPIGSLTYSTHIVKFAYISQAKMRR